MRIKTNKTKTSAVKAEAEPTVVTVAESKKTIHNVFIVDASGSMRGPKYSNAIKGLNVILKDILNDQETENTVMIVEFEGHNINTRIKFGTKNLVSYTEMGTGGMTPLTQAIGETLETVRNSRKDVNEKVLVNIFTDGQENYSQGIYKDEEYLSNFIKELEGEGFTITFVGTKNEVSYAINNLHMASTNTLVHNNSAEDIMRSFNDTSVARVKYSKSVVRGIDVRANFYVKTVKK